MSTPMRGRPAARIIGHRGAALLEPENTVRGFRRGLAEAAAGIECDVHLSSDGHVVVMHDATVDRTADAAGPRRTGAIAELTRAQLDEVLLGPEDRVPSLDEVLAVVDGAERDAELYVEVKAPAAAEAVARLVAGRPGVTVISFHPEALAAVRRSAPEVRIGLIVERTGEGTFDVVADLRAELLAVDVREVTPADAGRARRLDAELNVWTVNTAEHLARALAVGADTITTDDPAWLREELRRVP